MVMAMGSKTYFLENFWAPVTPHMGLDFFFSGFHSQNVNKKQKFLAPRRFVLMLYGLIFGPPDPGVNQ